MAAEKYQNALHDRAVGKRWDCAMAKRRQTAGLSEFNHLQRRPGTKKQRFARGRLQLPMHRTLSANCFDGTLQKRQIGAALCHPPEITQNATSQARRSHNQTGRDVVLLDTIKHAYLVSGSYFFHHFWHLSGRFTGRLWRFFRPL